MIKKVLSNELKTLLGHEPSKEEFISAYKYVSETLVDTDTLADVQGLLSAWRHECCRECDHCGEYFLADSVDECWFNHEVYTFCSIDCSSKHYLELRDMK